MKTTTFYIYEVPGHKNGCTTEWQKRSQYNFSMYGVWPILIETYNYPDEPEYWQIVGDREWELAEKNGYSKGAHYKPAREQRKIAQRIGAPLGGSANTQKQKAAKSIMGKLSCSNSKHQSNAGKAGGKAGGKIVQAIERQCPDCNRIIKGSGYFMHIKSCKQKQ
jgi:hypothetical protein